MRRNIRVVTHALPKPQNECHTVLSILIIAMEPTKKKNYTHIIPLQNLTRYINMYIIHEKYPKVIIISRAPDVAPQISGINGNYCTNKRV